MPPDSTIPEVLLSAATNAGVAFELRKDPRGVLDVPAIDGVIVGIHVGAPAKLACRRDGKQFNGTAVHGDIDIIPANMPSRWEMRDDNDTTLLMALPTVMLRSVVEDGPVEIRNRFQVRDSELEALGWALKREMEFGCPSGRFYLDGLALAVASRVVARHSSATTGARNDGLNGHRLKQVLAFIEDRLSSDVSVDEIAAVARVSPSHLNSMFRKSTGLPVHQYLIQRRVERAKSLLKHHDLSMADIAAAAGFAHQSHMARHMRRLLGVTPMALKRMLR